MVAAPASRSPFELVHGEQHLRQIAESIGAVFWMTDPGKGEMVYISPGYELIWGRTCESLYLSPISWIEAIDERDRAHVLAAAMERQIHGEYDETYRIVRPDGAVRWIRDRAFPVRDERGNVHRIAGVAEDVTERKQIDDALRTSQQRYQSLVDSLDGIIWEANPATFDFTFVSRQAERILGFPRDAWFAPGFFAATVHPDDRARAISFCLEMTARRVDHELEYRLVGPDGRVVWVRDLVTVVLEAGQVTTLRGVMVDVTATKQAEHALRRSERNFRTLIESSPQVICVVRDGRVVYLNRAGGVTLGYSDATQLVGREVRSIVVPDECEQSEKRLDGAQRGAFQNVTDRRLLRRDGTFVEVEVVSVPMTFDGKPSAVIIGRDVTDERRLRAQVALSNRMASVGTLAAGVAHEINNPLSFVAANLEFIQSELGSLTTPESEIRVAIDEATKGAERIRLVVRDLKAYSRPDESGIGAVDIHGVIESALSMAQNEIRHRARVTRVYGNVPRVSGNAARLGQVLLNLLVNASHAIPAGMAEHNEIRVETSQLADGRVCIEVTDTGAGIPAECLPHLFDPFFTTKPIGVGTGLGLFIVHGILAAMGAEITVESTVGVGTSFRVVLRLAPGEEALEEPSPLPVAPSPRRLKIIAIDDEPIIVSLLRRILPAHDVMTFTDPVEALAAIRGGGTCDVIFCDLMMPTMMGSELFAQLQSTHPVLADRIVFLTGGAFTPAASQFLDGIPNLCLEKPFTRATLLQVLADRGHD